MNASPLTEKPSSGDLPECSWASGSGPNAWVRFDDGDSPWVGIFGAGETNFTAVTAFGDDGGHTVLVIAGGQGYVIDVRKRVLVRRTDWEDAHSAATIPGAAFVVAADCTRIWLETRDGEIRTKARTGSLLASPEEPGRLAMDGIVIQAVRPTNVSGVGWWIEGCHAFDLDLTERTFVVGESMVAEPAGSDFGGFPCSESRSRQMRSYLLP